MTKYYITQTAIHHGREYLPLYLADPYTVPMGSFKPGVWSGNFKHTYFFDSQAEAERIMLTFHVCKEYIYTIIATSEKNPIEWRRTLP